MRFMKADTRISVVFSIYFFAAIHSSIITKEEKAIRQADYEEDIEMEVCFSITVFHWTL